MSRRWIIGSGVALALAVSGAAAYSMVATKHLGTPAEIAALPLPEYGEQKAVYHLTNGGGLRDSSLKNVLTIARNHLNAVGKDKLDLRVVVQGDGIELLTHAKTNPELASRIDALKRDGVKFLICRNTIVQRGIDPVRELYNFSTADLVRAGAGEATALSLKGYAYLKM